MIESVETYCTTVEILCSGENQRFVLWYALDPVCPFPSNFDCRLNGFCACVHGQNHVVAECVFDLLGPFGEDVVVECAGGEGESLRLFAECFYELGMTVPLVDGRVGR